MGGRGEHIMQPTMLTVLGFVDHTASDAATWLCLWCAKGDWGHVWTRDYGCVLIKLSLQTLGFEFHVIFPYWKTFSFWLVSSHFKVSKPFLSQGPAESRRGARFCTLSVVWALLDSKLKAIEGTFSSAGDCGPCMLCRWGQQVWPSPSAERKETRSPALWEPTVSQRAINYRSLTTKAIIRGWGQFVVHPQLWVGLRWPGASHSGFFPSKSSLFTNHPREKRISSLKIIQHFEKVKPLYACSWQVILWKEVRFQERGQARGKWSEAGGAACGASRGWVGWWRWCPRSCSPPPHPKLTRLLDPTGWYLWVSW